MIEINSATPEEIAAASVDFSILNDEDWFYIEDKKGHSIIYNKKVGAFYTNTLEKIKSFTFSKTDVEKLEKSIPSLIQCVFNAHPELAPPKAGDYGIVWDNTAPETDDGIFLRMRVLEEINDNSHPFCCGDIGWRNFYKIDINKPLSQIIEDFKNRKK